MATEDKAAPQTRQQQEAAAGNGIGVRTNTIETGEGKDNGATLERQQDGSMLATEQTSGRQSVEPGAEDMGDNDADREVKPLEGDEGNGDETTAELPDFKPDDPDAVAAYDKVLTNGDGGLNLDAFSAQWWNSVKDGDLSKGTLTEGTYEYLQSQFGISKEQAKEIEAGQIAQRQAEQGSLTARAGGVEPYKAALLWGRKGAYTPEQVKAFNEAVNGKDRQKANDAVDLLMARYDKASRPGSRPKKTTSGASHGGAGDTQQRGVGYPTKQAWLDARKAAGRDMVKQQAVSNMFRQSNSKGW